VKAASEDLNRIAAFLARRDVESLSPDHAHRVDVLVLCGSAVLASIDVAATALHAGLADRLLVSGGLGHSTPWLVRAVRAEPAYDDVSPAGRPEAAVIAEILRRHHGVPDGVVMTEEASTNCGENAAFSVDLLRRDPSPPTSLLLVQDPTMQRRTHASFRRALRGVPDVAIRSYAPFVPAVRDSRARHVRDDDGRTVWSLTRFRALLLGEVRRLHDDAQGYGPRGTGFIDHVDVPSDVLAAYRRLALSHPDAVREPGRS
jgi:uncharacterized SAM-binding protein YcdF (DUF218 family)